MDLRVSSNGSSIAGRFGDKVDPPTVDSGESAEEGHAPSTLGLRSGEMGKSKEGVIVGDRLLSQVVSRTRPQKLTSKNRVGDFLI